MNKQLPILHLRTPHQLRDNIRHEKSSPKSPNLYSLTNCSLSSAVAPAKLNGKGIHLMHTKQGEVTRQGLAKGYIQASPFYPSNSLHITMDDEVIYVKGKRESGNRINKAFAKIKDAREYLYKTR